MYALRYVLAAESPKAVVYRGLRVSDLTNLSYKVSCGIFYLCLVSKNMLFLACMFRKFRAVLSTVLTSVIFFS